MCNSWNLDLNTILTELWLVSSPSSGFQSSLYISVWIKENIIYSIAFAEIVEDKEVAVPEGLRCFPVQL